MVEPYIEEPETLEFSTTIKSVTDSKFVVLEKSYFYPRSGGQPHDEGVLVVKDEAGEEIEYPVVFVIKVKETGEISHEVDAEGKPPLSVGMSVSAKIDGARRKALRRAHTAAHIVSAVINRETGAMITGNQLALDKVRIDFSLPEFDPGAFPKYIGMANELIAKALPVESSVISRAEMEKDPLLVKLAKGFPPEIQEVRVVSIEGLDRQACGGTHVANTADIGPLELLKVENKGAKNRRVYFALREA